MREIKFRVWNKTTGEYGYTDKGLNITFPGILSNDDIVLEQYTGLKDQNGKEIYEGDILKYTEDGDSFISEVKYFENDDFYPVFDIEAPNDFYFESNVLSAGVANNCLEIVGNIHENTDLLEASK